MESNNMVSPSEMRQQPEPMPMQPEMQVPPEPMEGMQ
jgi:hypothetical protein